MNSHLRQAAAIAALFSLCAGTAQASGIFADPENWLDRHGHCFWCHDSRAEMRSWLEQNRDYEAKHHTLAPLVHTRHFQSSKDIAACTNCHGDGPKAHWKTDVERETCIGCHDVDAVTNHKNYKTGKECQSCHTPQSIREVHLGKTDKIAQEKRRDLASVRIADAGISRDSQGKARIEVSFELRDRQGAPIDAGANPAQLDWMDSLVIYTNWGLRSGFEAPRGYPIYVKSNFKDIRQTHSKTTPFGERERAELVKHSGTTYTYRSAPFDLPPNAEFDAADSGMLMTTFTYCFDNQLALASCAKPGVEKNAAWNQHLYFTASGLAYAPIHTRETIAGNQKCGFCHGYDFASGNTQLQCGNCHSENTKINGVLAGTKHFAGNDGIIPQAVRSNKIREVKSFYSANTDVEGCVICHNASNPPTSAIREKRIDPKDPHYIDELIVSHPAWNVFVHALHANTRPGQENAQDIRHMSYPPHTSSCKKCHMGETYSPAHLERTGKPLALASGYNADSKAYPAVLDAKADLYASPAAASCYACHAKKVVGGKTVWNDKAKQHITEMGGSLGVKKADVKPEHCSSCHTASNLKSVHRFVENGYTSKLPMHPSFIGSMPIPPGGKD